LESPVIASTDIQHQQHLSPLHKESPIRPLVMTAGHVKMGSVPTAKSASATPPSSSNIEVNDRSKKFFCGTTWHDAASKCGTPCPSGMTHDCPQGETCYADTPCDEQYAARASRSGTASETSLLSDTNNVTQHYHLTPAGGLPSVATLWSSGFVTLHSIAAPRVGGGDDGDFRVQLSWRLNLWPANKRAVEWIEQTIRFVSAVDADNEGGILLVSLNVEMQDVEEDKEGEQGEATSVGQSMVVAIHARTGKILWRSRLDDDDQEAAPLPLQRGTTSLARRRSLIPNVYGDQNVVHQHCLQSAYRRPLLMSSHLDQNGALPFSYWTEEDTAIRTLHFDMEQPASSQLQPVKETTKGSDDSKKKKHPKHHRRNHLHYGKPNVVVTHDQSGIQVRSFRNGHTLCHLGLSEETVYADLNHDGILDSLQIVTGYHGVQDGQEQAAAGEDADDDYRFVTELATRMASASNDEEGSGNVFATGAPLCHLLALSGLPSKEKLFSADLCGGKYDGDARVEGAPPLLVEPMYGKGWDIIAAMNTGAVHRFRGASGFRQWKYEGNHQNGFPYWRDRDLPTLGRVESYNVVPAHRPILLVGVDALAILSAETGELLAAMKFPQPAIHRAILVDFDGDGTTDVLVQTNDALWAFKVVVRTGSSIMLRILVGLLLMGLLLAMLRNRYGPYPGKRSTDI
jgi:hypothetical protein